MRGEEGGEYVREMVGTPRRGERYGNVERAKGDGERGGLDEQK
jgi:hypothetical protein